MEKKKDSLNNYLQDLKKSPIPQSKRRGSNVLISKDRINHFLKIPNQVYILSKTPNKKTYSKSPNRQKTPNYQKSSNRQKSPNCEKSPNRQKSPNCQKSPNYLHNPYLKKSPYKNIDDISSKVNLPKHHHKHGLITSNNIQDDEYIKFTSSHNHSFKEFSLCQFQNKINREYMEDRFSILVNFPHKEQNKSLFAIFDGHGGNQISHYLMNNFFSVFLKFSEKYNNQNYEKIFQKTFSHLDDEIKKIQNSQTIGSTATIILLTKEMDQILGPQKVIYSVNLGDSNCQLINKNGYKKITYEHRCNDDMEEKRIKKGNIINGRVGGNISVTRSFGDFNMREFGLISEPYINKILVNDNEKNFLVLASDGVWDFIGEEELFYSCFNNDDSYDICKKIMEKAKENGSTDNMTLIVIKL